MEHHCYACNFSNGTLVDEPWPEGHYWKANSRAYTYEACLEAIEAYAAAHNGEFTKAAAWRWTKTPASSGPYQFGPTEYAMMTNVIKDLYLHGLIRCVRRDRAGRCRLWTVNPKPKVEI